MNHALVPVLVLLVLPLVGSTTVTSVLESLACGLPVVTNRGGIADYLDHACSVMLDVGDVDGMVGAALALLGDDTRRRRMAGAARARGLAFSWPRSVERMRAVYDRIAEGM